MRNDALHPATAVVSVRREHARRENLDQARKNDNSENPFNNPGKNPCRHHGGSKGITMTLHQPLGLRVTPSEMNSSFTHWQSAAGTASSGASMVSTPSAVMREMR